MIEGSDKKVNEALAAQLRSLIEAYPTFGYRRLWAMLRRKYGLLVNRKTVYRILKVKGWFCHQRVATPRPCAKAMRSRTEASNMRWAMDVTHIPCGSDGWGHLAVVTGWIDWYNSERPHHALGYLSPLEFRQNHVQKVA